VHADEDRQKREVIEARNQLDGLVYQTEKTLGEHRDALDPTTRGEIETAITEAKQALEGEDAARLRAASDTLARASHKLAEVMYNKASQAGGGDGAGATAANGGAGAEARRDDDDVVEAEFEEVKE
jgi:molecular chaperone DnaK